MNMPALMFLYPHGGLNQVVDNPRYHDVNPGLPLTEAINSRSENGWVPIYPKPGKSPRMLVHTRVNPLRRWPSPQLAKEHLWPQFELIVGVNVKMSSTAAAVGHRAARLPLLRTPRHQVRPEFTPYYVVGDQAVEPIGESKNDWEWAGLLARKSAGACSRRERSPRSSTSSRSRATCGGSTTTGPSDGRFTPEDDLPYYELAMGDSPEIGTHPLARSREDAARSASRNRPLPHLLEHLHGLREGRDRSTRGSGSREQGALADADGPPAVLPRPRMVHRGRRAHADPQGAAARRAATTRCASSGATRAGRSIRPTRDEPLMLQMQRGEPGVCVGPTDAAARGIVDNDRVRDLQRRWAAASWSRDRSSVQPGQMIIYHAWEPHAISRTGRAIRSRCPRPGRRCTWPSTASSTTSSCSPARTTRRAARRSTWRRPEHAPDFHPRAG